MAISFSLDVKFGTPLRLLLVILLLLITVDRLPGPIQELPESPTPTPEQSAKPKPQRTPQPKATSESSESSRQRQTGSPQSKAQAIAQPERFAGSWNGTISRGIWGNVSYTLVVNATGTSVKEISYWGSYDRPSRWDGYTVTFRSGGFNELTCTITPDSKGKTARVTMKGLAQNGDSVFRKTSQ